MSNIKLNRVIKALAQYSDNELAQLLAAILDENEKRGTIPTQAECTEIQALRATCYQQALELNKKQGDKNGRAIVIENIANEPMYLMPESVLKDTIYQHNLLVFDRMRQVDELIIKPIRNGITALNSDIYTVGTLAVAREKMQKEIAREYAQKIGRHLEDIEGKIRQATGGDHDTRDFSKPQTLRDLLYLYAGGHADIGKLRGYTCEVSTQLDELAKRLIELNTYNMDTETIRLVSKIKKMITDEKCNQISAIRIIASEENIGVDGLKKLWDRNKAKVK